MIEQEANAETYSPLANRKVIRPKSSGMRKVVFDMQIGKKEYEKEQRGNKELWRKGGY